MFCFYFDFAITLIRSRRSTTQAKVDNATIEVLRRYPFLHSPVQNDSKNWTNLYNATNFVGPLSRESTPQDTPEEQTSTQGNSILDGEFQSQPSMSDMSFLDDEHMQQFLPWQSSDFQWNETDTSAAMKASNGMPAIGTDQNLPESFANYFSPKTRWHVLNGFNTVYPEP